MGTAEKAADLWKNYCTDHLSKNFSYFAFTNLVSLVLVVVVWDQVGDGGGGVEEIHLGNFSLKAQGVTFRGLRRYMVHGRPLGPFQPSPPPYFPPKIPLKRPYLGYGGPHSRSGCIDLEVT